MNVWIVWDSWQVGKPCASSPRFNNARSQHGCSLQLIWWVSYIFLVELLLLIISVAQWTNLVVLVWLKTLIRLPLFSSCLDKREPFWLLSNLKLPLDRYMGCLDPLYLVQMTWAKISRLGSPDNHTAAFLCFFHSYYGIKKITLHKHPLLTVFCFCPFKPGCFFTF